MIYRDNYPQVPSSIIDAILKTIANRPTGFSDKINQAVEQAYGKPLDTNIEGLATMSMFKDEALTQWVRDNITTDFNAVHVQYFTDGTYFFPHVDLLRTRALNYIISTADADTVFYSATDSLLDIKPNTMIPYNSIEPIARYNIKPYVWHELEVDKIHSVENINGTRIAITVSFV